MVMVIVSRKIINISHHHLFKDDMLRMCVCVCLAAHFTNWIIAFALCSCIHAVQAYGHYLSELTEISCLINRVTPSWFRLFSSSIDRKAQLEESQHGGHTGILWCRACSLNGYRWVLLNIVSVEQQCRQSV